MKKALVTAVAMLAFRAAAASAQPAEPTPPGPWQFGISGGGWNSVTHPYVFKGSSFSADVAFANAPCFGLSAGRDVSRILGIELAWTQTHPEEQFVGSPPTPIRQVTMNIFELDSLWYFGRGRLRGFATFGLGGSSTGSSFGGTNLTVIVGLGVKAFVDRHFAVRADVRFHDMYGNIGTNGGPAFCDSAGCYFYKRSWYSSILVTAGLTYAF